MTTFAGRDIDPTYRKFYITGGIREDGSAYIGPPFVAYGVDRLDALSRACLTVWEEAEYRAAAQPVAETS